MNKKIILSFLVFILFFSFYQIVKADDGGPNTVFWVTDQKTHCASFLNPEIVGSDSFLIFDYSAKVGQKMGKPWTIVEKGKCYQVDDRSEKIYLVKIVKGNERETFSNYSLYAPTDSVSQVFCKNDESHGYYDCSVAKFGYSITEINFLGEYSGTVSASEDIHFTGITANSLFPTKYDFGFPITYFSAMTPEGLKPMMNDQSFIAVSNLYTSLAKQLDSVLQSCDTRVRVENQYNITENQYNAGYNGSALSLLTKNAVWRLANNKDVIIQTFDSTPNQQGIPLGFTKPDIFNEIDLMGCKSAFSSFIQTHQTDFDTIDRLTQEVVAKYPSALEQISGVTMIHTRDNTEIVKILAFTNTSGTTEAVTSTTVTTTQTQVVSPTVMDEPTPDKKTDILLQSQNPFMRAYVLLPFIAIIGILLFLLLRKNQKNK